MIDGVGIVVGVGHTVVVVQSLGHRWVVSVSEADADVSF